MSDFNFMTELNVGLLLFAAMVVLFLLIGAVTDQTRSRTFMKCFIALLFAAEVMLLGEAGIWFFGGKTKYIPLLYFCAFLSLSMGAALNSLFAYCLLGFVKERGNVSWKYAHFIAGISGFCILLVFLSLWNGMLFYFNAEARYADGPWYIIVEIVDLVSKIHIRLLPGRIWCLVPCL